MQESNPTLTFIGERFWALIDLASVPGPFLDGGFKDFVSPADKHPECENAFAMACTLYKESSNPGFAQALSHMVRCVVDLDYWETGSSPFKLSEIRDRFLKAMKSASALAPAA